MGSEKDLGDAPSLRESPKRRSTAPWEAQCLSCDPFEGDFGGSGSNDGVLADKIVRARIDSECHTCAGLAERGQLTRVRAEVFDGEFMRFRWCEPCCRAMAEGAENPDAYEARVALGQSRRAAASLGQRKDGAPHQKDHPHAD